jgi:hypothetical protein
MDPGDVSWIRTQCQMRAVSVSRAWRNLQEEPKAKVVVKGTVSEDGFCFC